MKSVTKPSLSDDEKLAITRLWNSEYPAAIKYDSVADFDTFLNGLSGHRHFLLCDDDGNIKAWLLAFTRDRERWFSIIVDTSEQRKGYGKMLLDEVRKSEPELNGWVAADDEHFRADGERYISPLNFYRKLGFMVLDDVTLTKGDFHAVKIRWAR